MFARRNKLAEGLLCWGVFVPSAADPLAEHTGGPLSAAAYRWLGHQALAQPGMGYRHLGVDRLLVILDQNTGSTIWSSEMELEDALEKVPYD